MEDIDISQLVPTFMSITGADDKTAQHYVEMANLNLDNAIQLFFEYSSSGHAPPAPQTTQTPQPIDVDDPFYAPDDFDDVRAPIPTYHDCLLYPSTVQAPINEERRRGKPTSQMFEGTPLAKMFATESSDKSLADCMKECRDEKKWVLVHIHRDDEFSSFQLIRDVWNNPMIKEMFLSKAFQLWFREENTLEGEDFKRRYSVTALPHVSVIDPRTGQQVKVFNVKNLMKDAEAASIFSEFLEKHVLGPNTKFSNNASNQNNTTTLNNTSFYQDNAKPLDTNPITTSTDNTNTNTMESTKDENLMKRKLDETPDTFFDIPAEPDANIPFVKVRIALLNGDRIVRKISKTDTVEEIIQLCCALCRTSKNKLPYFEVRIQESPSVSVSLNAMDQNLTANDIKISGAVLVTRLNE